MTTDSTLTLADIADRLPPLPDGATFAPVKVERVSIPHPFVITPRHLTGDSMYLNEDTIERSGAPCGYPGCNLGVREHETLNSLFVEVENNQDLNANTGLHAWLLAIKGIEGLGIEGFAFPQKGGAR